MIIKIDFDRNLVSLCKTTEDTSTGYLELTHKVQIVNKDDELSFKSDLSITANSNQNVSDMKRITDYDPRRISICLREFLNLLGMF